MPATILIVSSSDLQEQHLKAAIEAAGFRTIPSPRAQALAHCETHEPDAVILLDAHELATLELCESLRETPLGAVMPLILVGAPKTLLATRGGAHEWGADANLSAPADPIEMLKVLHMFLGGELPEAASQPPPQAPAPERMLFNAPPVHDPSVRIFPSERPTSVAPETRIALSPPPGEPKPTFEFATDDVGPLPKPPQEAAVQNVPSAPSAWRVDQAVRHRLESQLQKPTHLASTPQHADTPRPLSPPTGPITTASGIDRVLYLAWKQNISGRIDFTQGLRQKTLFFCFGSVCTAYSSQPYDRLEEYLHRHSKLTRTHYQDVRTQGLRTPREVGNYVVRQGFLKPQELFDAVRTHLEETVCSLFEWTEGTYLYKNELPAEDDRITLTTPPAQLIFEGIKRKIGSDRLVHIVGAPNAVPTLALNVLKHPSELGGATLRPAELRVLENINGVHTISDLIFSSPLEAPSIYQILAFLLRLEALTIRPGDPYQTPLELSQADELDRTRIHEKLTKARREHYFDILGISPHASTYEVDKAYESQLKELNATALSQTLRTELSQEIAEIEEVLTEAHLVLQNPRVRTLYAQNLGLSTSPPRK